MGLRAFGHVQHGAGIAQFATFAIAHLAAAPSQHALAAVGADDAVFAFHRFALAESRAPGFDDRKVFGMHQAQRRLQIHRLAVVGQAVDAFGLGRELHALAVELDRPRAQAGDALGFVQLAGGAADLVEQDALLGVAAQQAAHQIGPAERIEQARERGHADEGPPGGEHVLARQADGQDQRIVLQRAVGADPRHAVDAAGFLADAVAARRRIVPQHGQPRIPLPDLALGVAAARQHGAVAGEQGGDAARAQVHAHDHVLQGRQPQARHHPAAAHRHRQRAGHRQQPFAIGLTPRRPQAQPAVAHLPARDAGPGFQLGFVAAGRQGAPPGVHQHH